jgi:hypothetical protein
MNVSAMESEDSATYLLPSANMLCARLSTIPECRHFIDNSPTIARFADQKHYAPAVFMIVGFEKEDYGKKFKNTPDIENSLLKIEAVKPRMVELILQDHPAAIANLKKNNIMIDPIQFPSAAMLRHQLNTAKFDHFAEKSSIIKLLATQKKYPTEVGMILMDQMELYTATLPSFMRKANMALMPQIISVLLKDDPKAIDWLQMDNWIE